PAPRPRRRQRNARSRARRPSRPAPCPDQWPRRTDRTPRRRRAARSARSARQTRPSGPAGLNSFATLHKVSRTFNFVQVDAFADRVFGGNQLAVFYDLEPGALSDAEMQAIALEMNLAETTFVYPPMRADCIAQV